MSSPAVVDFAKYLAEIPPSPNGTPAADPAAPALPPNPAGVDLRADRTPPSLYDEIKGAVSTARAAEYSAVSPSEDTSRPDWIKVLENGAKALSEKTKDLEIAAFLIEALLRLHGFAGLRDGFRLARELIEKYWDRLYPVPLPEEGEDNVAVRVNALAQVLRAEGRSALTIPIARLPLVEASTSLGRLALEHYQRAVRLNSVSDPKVKQKQIEQGAPTLDMFQQAVQESSPQFFLNLVEDLTGCLDELAKLGLALDKRCGKDSPATSNLRKHLTDCLDAVKDVAQSKLPPPPADVPAEPGTAAQAGGAAAKPAEALDVIRDREDAFRVLGKVAEFFRKTEPHSVVSYALEQVVRWGKMPLADLLSELIPDDAPRKNLFQRVGIKPAEPPKGESKK